MGLGEGGAAAGLVGEDVGTVVREDGVRRLGEEGTECNLVAHCAGEDKEGRFFTGELGHVVLEIVGRGVFAPDVVHKATLFDGSEHGEGWSGDCVGAEVEGCWACSLPCW